MERVEPVPCPAQEARHDHHPLTADHDGRRASRWPATSTRSPSGPTARSCCSDHYLIEKMAHFNRERIPERQPHAKGGGAFGVFEVTQDVSRYTKAALFQPGTRTDMLARFSTVAGEQGSPDTWRDPRGFALKFYTERGQLRPGRQQHAGLLRPGPDEVPALHPLAEAPRGQRPARPRHAVGLLDALARVRAPGDLADGRPRHPEDLAAHERLRQPHLQLGQRRRRAVLGQVPLQDRPGHRVPHPGRGRPDGRQRRRRPPARPVSSRSSAASTRAGR